MAMKCLRLLLARRELQLWMPMLHLGNTQGMFDVCLRLVCLLLVYDFFVVCLFTPSISQSV